MFTIWPVVMVSEVYTYVKVYQVVHCKIFIFYFMSVSSVNKLHAILNYLCNSALLQIIIILSHRICVIVGSWQISQS